MTRFYQPDVVKALQVSGVYFVRTQKGWPSTLVAEDPSGELLLYDNVHWLRKTCTTYRVPYTETTWTALSSVFEPDVLFDTEFGILPLPEAVRRLRLSLDTLSNA